jgi:hypothetical protein
MKTRVPSSDNLNKFNIDTWSPFSGAPCHILWGIIFDLKIFHPGLCLIALDKTLSLSNDLARDMRLFSRLKRSGSQPAMRSHEKRHAIACKRRPIKSLLIWLAREHHCDSPTDTAGSGCNESAIISLAS